MSKRSNEAEVDVDTIDRVMMARCIELSRIGAAAGELPFGSLVARHGRILSESTNEIMRLFDESRHAEIIAIARARQLVADHELSDCTLYSSVEPCPMCSFCIRAAGIGRVVFALGSPFLGGMSRWNILGDERSSLLFGPAPELISGVLADDARQVWIDLRPVAARAMWLFGFLTNPKSNIALRSRHRFSLRRLISMFVRRPRSMRASTLFSAVSAPDVDANSLEQARPGPDP